jgi:hypothetical protein
MTSKSDIFKYALILVAIVLVLSFLEINTATSSITDKIFSGMNNVLGGMNLHENPYLKEGFFKFAIFFAVFAIVYSALQKVDIFEKQKRIAIVVAVVFSAIGVFSMPSKILLFSGGVITGLVSSAVFLIFFLGLTYISLFKLDKNFVEHLAGLAIMIALVIFLPTWADATGVNMQHLATDGNIASQIYSFIVKATQVIILIATGIKGFNTAGIKGSSKGSPEKTSKLKKKLDQKPSEELKEDPQIENKIKYLMSDINKLEGISNSIKESLNKVEKVYQEIKGHWKENPEKGKSFLEKEFVKLEQNIESDIQKANFLIKHIEEKEESKLLDENAKKNLEQINENINSYFENLKEIEKRRKELLKAITDHISSSSTS